jgi:lipoate-protein ligase A
MRPSDRGIEVLSGAWKAPGGLIRADFRASEGLLIEVRLTGDFFLYPQDALEELERALSGVRLTRSDLMSATAEVMDRSEVEAVGFGPEDVVNAILGPP